MAYTDTLEQHPNCIDSRDIIERLEELRNERDADPIGFDEQEELTRLEEFENEQGAVDWEHGEQFIRDDYFEEYAEELVKDCGYIPAEVPSWIAIDWEKTAAAVQQDYSSIEYDGITYWYR